MVRSKLMVVAILVAVWSGCQCRGGNGGTPDAGHNGGDPDAGGGGDGDAGTTDPFTHGGVTPGTFTLDPNTAGSPSGDGVAVDPTNGIVLNTDSSALHYMWVANNARGTVSKFDTRTGNEMARYYSVIPRSPDGSANATRYNVGNSPSRTAIDVMGDVWIANRADGGAFLGSLTKISNSLSGCIDRNGNGAIDTSRDADGNGIIDVTRTSGADREFIVPSNAADPLQYDECVLFSVEVGTSTSNVVKGRALAVSKVAGLEASSAGEVWMGHWSENRVYKYDASSGEPLALNASTPDNWLSIGFGPYGAAVDGEQRLWILQAPGDVSGAFKLALVDTRNGTLVSNTLGPDGLQGTGSFPASTKGYGIAIDHKNRVWISGWDSLARVYRYDHGPGVAATEGTWTAFDLSAARGQNGTQVLGVGRGIAADTDGWIWMSAARNTPSDPATRAQLIAIHGDSVGGTNVTYKMFPITGGGQAHFVDYTDGDTSDSIGVGLDGENHVWVNNFSGNIMRIHRDTGELLKRTAKADQGGSLYSYSDFTGYQLRNFTAPRGTYARDFQGCGASTVWKVLTWAGNEPPHTNLRARVRSAADQAGLASAAPSAWFDVSGVDLEAAGVEPSRWLRLEFELTSNDRLSSPNLQSYDLAYHCPPIFTKPRDSVARPAPGL